MSSPQDDEVLQALKAELVAFLFDQSGERPRGAPTVAEQLSETVTGQVRHDLQRELHLFHDQVEATLEQSQNAGGGGFGALLRHPWFLAVLVVALLSIGVNVGLGMALLAKPKPAVETTIDGDDQASADASVSDMALELTPAERKAQEDKCKALAKQAERTKCLDKLKASETATSANAGSHH